jgi:hypothetical protein
MPRYARETKLNINQADLASAALAGALQDPDIKAMWYRTLELLATEYGWSDVTYPDPTTEKAVAELRNQPGDSSASLYALTSLVETRVPLLAHMFGPLLTPRLLYQIAYAHAPLEELAAIPDDAIPNKVYRLGPDNPIRILAGGGIHGYEDAKSIHRDQLNSYFDSLRPATKTGRPLGSKRQTSISRAQFVADYRKCCRELTRVEDRDMHVGAREKPTEEEFADYLGWSPKTVYNFRKKQHPPIPWPPI